MLLTPFSQACGSLCAEPSLAWPQRRHTPDCHEEDRDSGALPRTREATRPSNLGTKHGEATVNPAVTLWTRGRQTPDEARAPPPCSLAVPHHTVACGWVQSTGCGHSAQRFSCVWLSASGEEVPCLQTCAPPEEGCVHDPQKHQNTHYNCASSFGFRRRFIEKSEKTNQVS